MVTVIVFSVRTFWEGNVQSPPGQKTDNHRLVESGTGASTVVPMWSLPIGPAGGPGAGEPGRRRRQRQGRQSASSRSHISLRVGKAGIA